jgi:hypothetical protein
MGVSLHEITPSLLLDICTGFEDRYGMDSATFYTRYLNGEFVGIHDAYRWAGYWKAYQERREGTKLTLKGVSEELLAASQ